MCTVYLFHSPLSSRIESVVRVFCPDTLADPGGWILSVFLPSANLESRISFARRSLEIRIISARVDFRCRRRGENPDTAVADEWSAFARPWRRNLCFLDEIIVLDLRLRKGRVLRLLVTCSNPPGYLNAFDRQRHISLFLTSCINSTLLAFFVLSLVSHEIIAACYCFSCIFYLPVDDRVFGGRFWTIDCNNVYLDSSTTFFHSSLIHVPWFPVPLNPFLPK